MMEMFEDMVEELCDELDLDPVQIKIDPTIPTFAAYDGEFLLLRSLANKYDILYAIAHEMRHIWQMKNDEKKWMDGYRRRDECASTNEYNSQPAEVDANAFAYIIMTDFYGLTPKLEIFGPDAKALAEKRVQEILEEEYE